VGSRLRVAASHGRRGEDIGLTLRINATQAPVPAAMIALCTAPRCDLKPRHSLCAGLFSA
jgi:hypothetical protein